MWRQALSLSRRFTQPIRERKAKIELDAYDNPFLEVESTRVNHGDNELSSVVDPFPRRKLKELYLYTLEYIKGIPEDFNYRIFVEEFTRFRLKVVEESKDISAIEKTIGFGLIDDLILQATNELTLIEIFKNERIWEMEVSDTVEDFEGLVGSSPFKDVKFVHADYTQFHKQQQAKK
mmetsp:Transcript_30193/g.53480  ORF Transcript_30193/g.53480 Transcript_30193/m.53480 type:complete len:177 (-) Transcript_30193:4138-4668(-)